MKKRQMPSCRHTDAQQDKPPFECPRCGNISVRIEGIPTNKLTFKTRVHCTACGLEYSGFYATEYTEYVDLYADFVDAYNGNDPRERMDFKAVKRELNVT